MILQAFSQVLRREWQHPECPAVDILHRWLLAILTEAEPKDTISKVIHTEVELLELSDRITFIGKSKTGHILLQSLYQYCESYERWQFNRWLHQVKPYYFNQLSH